MKRETVFRIAAVLAVAGAIGAIWGGLRWLGSERGADRVSKWITARAAKNTPPTRVWVREIRLRWPNRLELGELVWAASDGEILARLEAVILELKALRWPVSKSGWSAQAQIISLDLSVLDRLFLKEDWRAQGSLAGPVALAGGNWKLSEIGFQLKAKDGGNVSSELLTRLIERMPPEDPQAALLKAAVSKATFHFNVGKLELMRDRENYSLRLWLDGDHLFDIVINIPREDLESLNDLLF